MIRKHATVVWEGTGKEGAGYITTQSGALQAQPYGFNTRFADKPGTNPEELVAAAHASCFAMATAFSLNRAGYTADSLDVKAVISMEKEGEGFIVRSSALTLQARVPGIGEEEFEKIVTGAKQNCPISKLLNAEITLEHTLIQA